MQTTINSANLPNHRGATDNKPKRINETHHAPKPVNIISAMMPPTYDQLHDYDKDNCHTTNNADSYILAGKIDN